jgi:hypothetical protein
MTDDLTRGLTLLADEAEPLTIDTDAVIATATRRTRNHAILTAALATIVLVGALAMTLVAVKPDQPSTADPPTAPRITTRNTPTLASASPAEQENRKTRLHGEITAGFDLVLPAGWEHSTFDWGCDFFHCWALGDILDGKGTLNVGLSAASWVADVSCDHRRDCTTTELDDGTRVIFARGDGPNSGDGSRSSYSISAKRPDGTLSGLDVWWSADRPAPALTDDQWIALATSFTY